MADNFLKGDKALIAELDFFDFYEASYRLRELKKENTNLKRQLTKIKNERKGNRANSEDANCAFVLCGGIKNKIMKEVIEKYKAKLEFLNESLVKTKHLIDSDMLEMMQDIKTLLEEVLSDFRALANES